MQLRSKYKLISFIDLQSNNCTHKILKLANMQFIEELHLV